MNLADLKAPFAPSKISWRVGSTTKDKSKGMALAYVDARDVQDRLDEVCGVENWQCRYVPMHDKKTVCEIGIRHFVHGSPELDERGAWKHPQAFEWIWKSDGAGDSDIEAEKGALSDAFKRAAVRFGIGRYLYDLESPWVELDTYEKDGKVFAKGIKAHEYKRLELLLVGNVTRQAAQHPAAAIYAPVERNGVGSTKAEAAKNWALGEIPRIKTMDRMALDKFSERFKKAREELKTLDPKTGVELEKALADRLEELFA